MNFFVFFHAWKTPSFPITLSNENLEHNFFKSAGRLMHQKTPHLSCNDLMDEWVDGWMSWWMNEITVLEPLAHLMRISRRCGNFSVFLFFFVWVTRSPIPPCAVKSAEIYVPLCNRYPPCRLPATNASISKRRTLATSETTRVPCDEQGDGRGLKDQATNEAWSIKRRARHLDVTQCIYTHRDINIICAPLKVPPIMRWSRQDESDGVRLWRSSDDSSPTICTYTPAIYVYIYDTSPCRSTKTFREQ